MPARNESNLNVLPPRTPLKGVMSEKRIVIRAIFLTGKYLLLSLIHGAHATELKLS